MHIISNPSPEKRMVVVGVRIGWLALWWHCSAHANCSANPTVSLKIFFTSNCIMMESFPTYYITCTVTSIVFQRLLVHCGWIITVLNYTTMKHSSNDAWNEKRFFRMVDGSCVQSCRASIFFSLISNANNSLYLQDFNFLQADNRSLFLVQATEIKFKSK